MRKPSCVDAFCGAGGLSIGLARAGFDVLLGFDIDPFCIRTLKANPELINHRVLEADVRTLLGGKLNKLLGIKTGELDLLAGGPPCQGFSVQRTTGPDDDRRSLLVDDYGALITETEPKFFLMENVLGIGGKRGRSILQRFCRRMVEIGYLIHTATLNASDFGVPQRRRRVFVIGERNEGGGRTRFKWPRPVELPPPTVRETIGHLPEPPADGSDHPEHHGHRADRLSEKNKQRIRALRQGQARTDLPEELLANCHKVSAEIVGHRNVYGRMSWDEVAPTITARFDSFTRGKFGHPEQNRTISLHEGALLQTFPSDFLFIGNKVEVARQIGNAVPPLLAEHIGRALLYALTELGNKGQ